MVTQQMGITRDKFDAHFFNNVDVSRMSSIISDYADAYQPKEFFLRELTAPYPSPILRKFHTDICTWYRHHGLEPEENKDLLFNEKAEDGQYWFNEKAILFYMVQNGFLYNNYEV